MISDGRFVRANEMCKGVTRKAKIEGRGETDSKPPIEPEDLESISAYFTTNMEGPPNAAKLQEINPFNIMYYMARRG